MSVKYNNVIDVSYEPVDPAVYPVSLDDMKRHLYLLFESEGGFSVDDDDTYIETVIIPAAMAAIEKYTGKLLRPCTVTASIRNDRGGIRLPYGPITAFTGMTDGDGDVVTSDSYKLVGNKVMIPRCSYLGTTYTAGYTADTLPADLFMAVLHQGAFLYRYRGDQQQDYAAANVGMSPSAKQLAHFHREPVWLL